MSGSSPALAESNRSAEEVEPALILRGVTKSFPGVRALSDVDFDCRPGEIHALVGENGSGKSTLIKVASGAIIPETGTVTIDGTEFRGSTPKASLVSGLTTAYQDTSLIHDLTVAQNITLAMYSIGLARPKDVEAALAEYGVPFSAGDLVADLGPGGRQLLEVVRALMQKPKILLLDEPTAALDMRSAERLHDLVLRAKADGVAIVYISHRLEEVKQLADRLTVIRDGVIQGTHDGATWEVDEIVELMVGAPVELEFPDRESVDLSTVVLRAEDLAGDSFGPVTIEVHSGEVVGIAGAEGNGQRALLRGLIGQGRDSGTVSVDGREVRGNTPKAALKAGISLQSGDRAAESIFGPLSVMHNSTVQLGSLAGPGGLVVLRRLHAKFSRAKRELGIVTASPYQPVSALSGGNQQKIVLSRPALKPPRLLIVDEPTQGVDARARLDIYRILADSAESGMGVLVNSSDSSELAGLCDRVYIMSRGRIVGELDGNIEESEIVRKFVTAEGVEEVRKASSAAPPWRKAVSKLTSSPRFPVGVLLALTVAVALYAGARNPIFWSQLNLANLFLYAAPTMLLAMGQMFALISGGFDISIGAQVSVAVVISSFVLTDYTLGGFTTGIAVVVGVGVVVGLFNAFLVSFLRVNPIVATIATLGILQGIAIALRPAPGGAIALEFGNTLRFGVWAFPTVFILIVVGAIALDVWLTRTGQGLSLRSVGFDEESSRRVGASVPVLRAMAFVLCAVGAALAGILVASQVGLGDNSVGNNFALPAFAACFLGGAALSGGRGTFVGAALGALFLALLVNVAPLLDIPSQYAQILTGVVMLAAVLVYTTRLRPVG